MLSHASRLRHLKNGLLNSLPAADFAMIAPFLETVYLEQGAELIGFGEKMETVYFPQSGAISLVVRLNTGNMVEVAMVSQSSVVGASAAFNDQTALTTAVVRLEGYASTLDVRRLRLLADKNADFRMALIRHEQALFIEVQQSAACMASHTSKARVATSLLRAHNVSGDGSLSMTREFLSAMLGLHRNAISAVAQSLQKAGLIQFNRGRVDIVNRPGLEHTACECYTKVMTESERLRNLDASGIIQAKAG